MGRSIHVSLDKANLEATEKALKKKGYTFRSTTRGERSKIVVNHDPTKTTEEIEKIVAENTKSETKK